MVSVDGEHGSQPRAPLSPHYTFVVQWGTDTHREERENL